MTASAWIHALGQKPECWYSNMVDSYPEQLCQMYATLRRMAEEGKVYGFFLELRDIYEGLIRWYVLTGIAYAECLGEKKLVALLCDPERSMSFGDWVNVFPRCLAKHLQIGNSPLGKLLAALEKQYNKEGIVRWRNEAIGHGALQQDTSEIFQGVLEEKLYALKKYLEDNATLAQQIVYYKEADGTLQCTVDSVSFRLEPFIRVVDGDYRLFDSMTDKEKQSLCLELSYQTGRRTTVNLPYLFELRSRYYGNAPVTGTDSFDEEVYTDQIEAALRFYHDPGQYWKQPYYTDWLTKCLAQHSKGVFLLQAESGTGKSTFCRHLDGFGRSALKKQGFVCRAYYFSRLSFRTKQEFVNTLCDMFSQIPENEDRLRGKLHTLSHDGDPKDCGAMMADFLNSFRTQYEHFFGRDKLLLILDGIDEMAPGDTDLLHFVPDAELLDESVYMLITCRSDDIGGTFQQDFIEGHSFVERKIFKKEEENRILLKQAVSDSVRLSGRQLTEAQVDQICTVLNDRFTGLPVIRAVLANTENLESALTAPSLLSAYVERLQQYYGPKQFVRVRMVLLTLALAYEPLNVRQIGRLALDGSPTVELLAIMRDLTPLLQSVRDRTGTKYVLGHPEFGDQLRSTELEDCQRLVNSWRGQIEGDLNLNNMDYDLGTYIAGGAYLWSKDILKETLMDVALLENMGQIAGYFSMSRDTGLHLSRMSRIFSEAKQGFVEHWQTTGETYLAIKALDLITACIPKLTQLEDRLGCQRAEEEAQNIVSKLPEGCMDEQPFVSVLFSSFTNRSILAEQFGDMETAQICHNQAIDLLFAHPDWIPSQLRIPFIHNCGISLLHTNPAATIMICDHELSFPERTPFDHARTLLLKSDALKAVQPPQQQAAGKCIREAVALVEHEEPKTAMDAVTYPNALWHLGSHLCHAERDFEGAIGVLTQVLSIHDTRYKHGALPDRFEGARILSSMGVAYHGIDVRNGNIENKEQSLWYHNQGIMVFRNAVEEHIRFRPASAEPIFTNAAFAYHYYQEVETATALLDELKEMQDPADPLSEQVIERCISRRQELLKDQSSAGKDKI